MILESTLHFQLFVVKMQIRGRIRKEKRDNFTIFTLYYRRTDSEPLRHCTSMNSLRVGISEVGAVCYLHTEPMNALFLHIFLRPRVSNSDLAAIHDHS